MESSLKCSHRSLKISSLCDINPEKLTSIATGLQGIFHRPILTERPSDNAWFFHALNSYIFNEFKVMFGILYDIGANGYVVITEFILQQRSLSGYNGMYSSYLVTNFPANFKR